MYAEEGVKVIKKLFFSTDKYMSTDEMTMDFSLPEYNRKQQLVIPEQNKYIF